MPERKQSFTNRIRERGILAFSLVQRLFIITLLSSITYILLFPLFIQISVEYLLNFLGIDPYSQIAILPELESNTDTLGITAYIIYIAVFLFLIRVFVVQESARKITNNMLFLAFFVAFINLFIYLIMTQAFLGTLAFIMFENISFEFPTIFNLSGLIIQNDIILIIFALILFPKPKKKTK